MYKKVSENVILVEATPEGLAHDFISCYIIESTGPICIVETGPASSANILTNVVREMGYSKRLNMVIPTHIHLDHGGGVGHILNEFGDAIGLIHPRGVKHVADPSKLWKAALEYLGWLAEAYGEPMPIEERRLRASDDGMELVFGDVNITILHTPGHAPHHQSVYLHNENSLFVGDSAGAYAWEIDMIVPTTNPPIKLDLYIDSLDKMIRYKPDRLYYTHYGYVDDGTEVLKAYRKLLIDLVKIAKEENPESIDDFKSIIRSSIEGADKIFEWVDRKPIYRSLMDLSLHGILLSK